MILLLGSCVLAAICLLNTWLVARKRVAGWIINFFSAWLNLGYDLYTHQYGWCASTLVGMWIAWRAWRSWRKA